jgi:hypothetical protein
MLLAKGKAIRVHEGEVIFDLLRSGRKITVLEPLVGRKGWITCTRFSVTALQTEDHLLFAAVTDQDERLDETQCRRLFDLPGEEKAACVLPDHIRTALQKSLDQQEQEKLDDIAAQNGRWFDIEMDKLDRWAEDRRSALRAELEELDLTIKETKKAARLAPNLPEKLDRQRELRKLEARRDEAWRGYDTATRELDGQKDALLDEISRRLQQTTEMETLFTIRWHLV